MTTSKNNAEATDDHQIDTEASTPKTTLPEYARSSLNRCNLPASILGGLTYQQHPQALIIDSTQELYQPFFDTLNDIYQPLERAQYFKQYMRSAYLLDQSGLAGFNTKSTGKHRQKANYLRLLRGWLFDSNSIEGAVLKHWAESRFGLLPRNHRGSITDPTCENYFRYQVDYTRGLYNTNALEAQLDTLYAYCQYEIKRRFENKQHVTLYRGTNQLDYYEILNQHDKHCADMLLNSVNSFSSSRDHASSFGDMILECSVPTTKVLYFPGLLEGLLQGEEEYLVIGGAYRVNVSY